ncbi:MAG TPA: transglutaminase-like domain-containing protein [Acidimicrobiia bacterium]|nr:transglutaminase-like domain-containing protein [Acidimicrobiia bacterium]
MDVEGRFAELLARSSRDVPLDEVASLVAAYVRDDASALDVAHALDDLARRCPTPTFDALRHHLFVVEGFRGDVDSYGDPANSFLDRVVERRRGIPITLSILLIGVGRRLGVDVVPVGMPGHFLVRDATNGERFCDPFGGGAVLDVDGCRRLFERVHGGAVPFAMSMLAPTPAPAVIARVLTNLEHGPLGREPVSRARLLSLHARIPGLGAAERLALGDALRRVGRLADAARVYDALADESSRPEADRLRREARRLRSMSN